MEAYSSTSQQEYICIGLGEKKYCGVKNEYYWYLASDLNLHDDAGVEWDHLIFALNGVGIRISEKEDALVWNWGGSNRKLMEKIIYEAILDMEGRVFKA